MANIPIYEGNPVWDANATTLGYYNTDSDFQTDVIRFTKFAASRLGYPIVGIELQSGSFFTAFENAITTYGNEVYSYLVRDNQLSLEGSNIFDGELNEVLVTPNFNTIIRLSEQYGSEAGVGGNLTYYTGEVTLTSSISSYDLKEWANEQNISGSIEVKRVFYESPPAVQKFFDPYVGTGFGSQNLFNSLGFGAFSPAVNFLMMPTSFDLQTIQAIEFNDQIRKSSYSFELRNNVLKIFPVPMGTGGKMKFEYIKTNERIDSSVDRGNTNVVTNVSNTPYANPIYSKINSIGRQWIFEYGIAIAKEMLGLVRGKFDNIPIPDSEVTLNHSSLLSQAATEKERLIESLKKYLDETSRKELLKRKSEESEFHNKELNMVPFQIYIG